VEMSTDDELSYIFETQISHDSPH